MARRPAPARRAGPPVPAAQGTYGERDVVTPGTSRPRYCLTRSASVLVCAGALAACGGGGGGASTGPGSGGAGPQPPAPAANRSPAVARPNADQDAVVAHPFAYDPIQGGSTFTDPDGDPLQYEIRLGSAGGSLTLAGLRVEGTRIVGAPDGSVVAVSVHITATDPRGSSVTDEFFIRVRPNGAPVADRPNPDLLVAAGSAIVVETVTGRATFSDPDRDAHTHALSLRGTAQGLSVAGTRVTGALRGVGVVEVTGVARDAYGGRGTDVFMIAVPAPPPGGPSLPDQPYAYADEAQPLPFNLKQAVGTNPWPADNPVTDAGAALGRVLFYDPRLSITNTHSCGSCHQQEHGFATTERFPTGPLGVPMKRNAMGLSNVRFNRINFWFSDMRAVSLEALVEEPIVSPDELGSSRELLESKLAATPFYPPLFQAAFGSPEITVERVSLAIAQFLKAMIAYRSKADLAFNPMENVPWDPPSVLDAGELRGLEIFTDGGRGRCNLCHDLNDGSMTWQANNGLDVYPTDPGTLDAGLQRDGSLGVFRAASLRNVEVTGPYMHDGRFATLREVIDHYDHGVQDGPHLDRMLRDQLYGPPIRLRLSEADKQALERFLLTMTDRSLLADPRFADPFR